MLLIYISSCVVFRDLHDFCTIWNHLKELFMLFAWFCMVLKGFEWSFIRVHRNLTKIVANPSAPMNHNEQTYQKCPHKNRLPTGGLPVAVPWGLLKDSLKSWKLKPYIFESEIQDAIPAIQDYTVQDSKVLQRSCWFTRRNLATRTAPNFRIRI